MIDLYYEHNQQHENVSMLRQHAPELVEKFQETESVPNKKLNIERLVYGETQVTVLDHVGLVPIRCPAKQSSYVIN